MNLTMRKLAMLEKNLIQKEENCKAQGFTTPPEDIVLREKLSEILNRARVI